MSCLPVIMETIVSYDHYLIVKTKHLFGRTYAIQPFAYLKFSNNAALHKDNTKFSPQTWLYSRRKKNVVKDSNNRMCIITIYNIVFQLRLYKDIYLVVCQNLILISASGIESMTCFILHFDTALPFSLTQICFFLGKAQLSLVEWLEVTWTGRSLRGAVHHVGQPPFYKSAWSRSQR